MAEDLSPEDKTCGAQGCFKRGVAKFKSKIGDIYGGRTAEEEENDKAVECVRLLREREITHTSTFLPEEMEIRKAALRATRRSGVAEDEGLW
jgi:hypothetical protein